MVTFMKDKNIVWLNSFTHNSGLARMAYRTKADISLCLKSSSSKKGEAKS